MTRGLSPSSGGRGLSADRVARGTRGAALTAMVVLAVAPASCRRNHVAGTPSTDAVLQAFKDVGLDVVGVSNAEADLWGADVCSAGKVSGLDVVICEFTSEPQLAKTEADTVQSWNAVNVDTGVTMHNGRTLLLVIDRDKGDPSGRIVGRMVTAFKQAQ